MRGPSSLLVGGVLLSVASCAGVLGLDDLDRVACVDVGSGCDSAALASDAGAIEDAENRGDSPSGDGPSTYAPNDAAVGDVVVTPDAHVDGGGPVCTQDLSNVGAGSFRIAFSLSTTQKGTVALLSQRKACPPNLAGSFWDLRMVDGGLHVELYDGANGYGASSATLLVNDGFAHAIVVQRTGVTITATVDGIVATTGSTNVQLSSLPPLQSGVDACQAPNTGADDTVALQGTLQNVCVTAP